VRAPTRRRRGFAGSSPCATPLTGEGGTLRLVGQIDLGPPTGAGARAEAPLLPFLSCEAFDAGERDSEALGDAGVRCAAVEGIGDPLAQVKRESFHTIEDTKPS
jgi:hypothetical protein